MRYVINEINKVETVNDGVVLLVEAYLIDDYSETESEETLVFAFPFSEQLSAQLSQISIASQKHVSFWEPNEDEFVEDVIENLDGDEIDVYKSIDLIPEVSMDDIIPLDSLFFDDDNDDEYDEEDDEYEDDLFKLDDPDISEQPIELVTSDYDGDAPEDIFNDFYSDDFDSAS